MSEKFLTPEEVAEHLNVKSATVRSWLREGKLRGLKFDKIWRIRENDLQEFIKKAIKGEVDSKKED